MLEIDSVTLSFWDKAVLSGCYISCKKGEIVGLLGRNGSGKSCLLKIIFGSLDADFKHLKIDGRIVKKSFQTKEVAYLPQENFLPPFLKTAEILSPDTLAQPLIQNNPLIRQIINKKVTDLSGGELRLLECIWVLNRNARYVLLDEPFSGLAPIQVQYLQEIISEAGKTKGIILTDHIYNALLEISSRIVLLHNNSVYNINEEMDLIRYNYIPDFKDRA